MAQTDLKVLVSAQVQGMEEISRLISRVGALEKEMARVQTAAGNATSGVAGLTRGLNDQSKALRNHRQGVQMAGMQINDFFTSVSTGASPMIAFNQQIGQLGYAMSMMKGVFGGVGAFLAGPWGAAIVAATAFLGPFIAKLFQTSDAADAAGSSIKNLIEKQAAFGQFAAEVARQKVFNELVDAERRLAVVQRSTGARFISKSLAGVTENERNVYRLRQQLVALEGEAAKAQRLMDKTAERHSSMNDRMSKNGGIAKAKKSVDELNDSLGTTALRFKDYEKWNAQPTNIAMMETINSMKDIAPVDVSVPTVLQDTVMITTQMADAFDEVGKSVDDAFKNMLLAGGSWRDGMRGIIQSVIDQLWKLYVTQQIVGMISGAITGLIGGGAPKLDQTIKPVAGFANGTMNASGGMALVGERGPELVNLPRGSQVIPAHRSSGMMGGMTVNVDARGSADPAAVRAQVQQGILEAAPAIIAAAEQRTVSNLRRPRLGGVMQ